MPRRPVVRAGAGRRTALSGEVEGTTKGDRVRYVPLSDQALGALDRLSRRPNSRAPMTTSSAAAPATGSTHRRYADATQRPAMRPACRRFDSTTSATPPERSSRECPTRLPCVTSSATPTSRRPSVTSTPSRASRLADAATRAFTPEAPHDRSAAARAVLRAAVEQFGPGEARRILDGLG